MVTIKDVSRAAGVSVATVSRVLNGNTGVSEETRARVEQAVQALDYAPNISARNLRRHESRIILILAPNVTNPYYAHIIAGIGRVAHQYGYASFLCNTEGDRAQEEQLLAMLGRGEADGAILLASAPGSDWILPYAKEYPIVQCSEFDPATDIPHVAIDNYAATRAAMQHLLSLGHRRIGIISSENNYLSTALRLKGYRDALREAGIEERERYIQYAAVDYTFRSGLAAARRLLTQEKRPTALFAISDMLALGAIEGAKEMGFRVPEDVTVVGFDDVEETTMFHPYITSVAQPCMQIGERAMGLLLDQMAGKEVPREVLLPFELIQRESSAPYRNGDLF